MAYAKRSLKKKTTKKRSTMKRKAPKAKVTSRGRAQSSAPHRQTGYARALSDPKDGPLVGVPQFVPVDTHRVRTRAIGVVNSVGGSARIFFNPCRMGASNAPAILVNSGATKWTGAINDYPRDDGANHSTSHADRIHSSISSNAPYTAADFQSTSAATVTTIDNGDGVKCRVVGAMIRVCNVSAANTRGGVFTALHEPHHKTLEDFDLAALSKNSKTIIRPAGDGGYISLLYRPVKPEEVEDWQISPYVVPGQQSLAAGGSLDGTAADAFPGYMCIDFQGEPNSTLHVEAYAVIEYAGETVTALSRPVSAGGGKAGKPSDVPPATKDAALKEQLQGTSGCEVKTAGRTLAQCDAANGEAQQQADKIANIAEKDPPHVIRETRYSIVIENPDGTHDVYFKGTNPTSAREWAEDAEGAFGFHVKAWDTELQYLEDTYGYESDKVHYSGFSRGGGLAQYMGGTGYGSGHFHQYPPREGSRNARSDEDWHDSHSALNAWLHDHLIEPGSRAVDEGQGVMEDVLPDQLNPHNY